VGPDDAPGGPAGPTSDGHFGTDLADRLARRPLAYDFGVQLFRDEASTPIEGCTPQLLLPSALPAGERPADQTPVTSTSPFERVAELQLSADSFANVIAAGFNEAHQRQIRRSFQARPL